MGTFGDSPGVHCHGPAPATPSRSRGRPQREDVTPASSGSCPGEAQLTCCRMWRPSGPLARGEACWGCWHMRAGAACGRGRFTSVCWQEPHRAFCQHRGHGAWRLPAHSRFVCPTVSDAVTTESPVVLPAPLGGGYTCPSYADGPTVPRAACA